MKAFEIKGIRFFFQAEDGIRDIGVTGVQTCALPIFAMKALLEKLRYGVDLNAKDVSYAMSILLSEKSDPHQKAEFLTLLRSEERRVGKECIFRGLATQLKKKETMIDMTSNENYSRVH